jgi:hypothetical protein
LSLCSILQQLLQWCTAALAHPCRVLLPLCGSGWGWVRFKPCATVLAGVLAVALILLLSLCGPASATVQGRFAATFYSNPQKETDYAMDLTRFHRFTFRI